MTEQIKCSCSYPFKKHELEGDTETCPKCKKYFCYNCGDSVTTASVNIYGYSGDEYSCGNCGELLA